MNLNIGLGARAVLQKVMNEVLWQCLKVLQAVITFWWESVLRLRICFHNMEGGLSVQLLS